MADPYDADKASESEETPQFTLAPAKMEGAPGPEYMRTSDYVPPDRRGNNGVTQHHKGVVDTVANSLKATYNNPNYKKEVFDDLLVPGSNHNEVWAKHGLSEQERKPYDMFRRNAYQYRYYSGMDWDPNQKEAIITPMGTDRDKRITRKRPIYDSGPEVKAPRESAKHDYRSITIGSLERKKREAESQLKILRNILGGNPVFDGNKNAYTKFAEAYLKKPAVTEEEKKERVKQGLLSNENKQSNSEYLSTLHEIGRNSLEAEIARYEGIVKDYTDSLTEARAGRPRRADAGSINMNAANKKLDAYFKAYDLSDDERAEALNYLKERNIHLLESSLTGKKNEDERKKLIEEYNKLPDNNVGNVIKDQIRGSAVEYRANKIVNAMSKNMKEAIKKMHLYRDASGLDDDAIAKSLVLELLDKKDVGQLLMNNSTTGLNNEVMKEIFDLTRDSSKFMFERHYEGTDAISAKEEKFMPIYGWLGNVKSYEPFANENLASPTIPDNADAFRSAYSYLRMSGEDAGVYATALFNASKNIKMKDGSSVKAHIMSLLKDRTRTSEEKAIELRSIYHALNDGLTKMMNEYPETYTLYDDFRSPLNWVYDTENRTMTPSDSKYGEGRLKHRYDSSKKILSNMLSAVSKYCEALDKQDASKANLGAQRKSPTVQNKDTNEAKEGPKNEGPKNEDPKKKEEISVDAKDFINKQISAGWRNKIVRNDVNGQYGLLKKDGKDPMKDISRRLLWIAQMSKEKDKLKLFKRSGIEKYVEDNITPPMKDKSAIGDHGKVVNEELRKKIVFDIVSYLKGIAGNVQHNAYDTKAVKYNLSVSGNDFNKWELAKGRSYDDPEPEADKDMEALDDEVNKILSGVVIS